MLHILDEPCPWDIMITCDIVSWPLVLPSAGI